MIYARDIAEDHQPKRSKSDIAYSEIRRRITVLDLAPGEVINEETLQAELGIGRTPIREAVQRLARDQLLTVMPRRGIFVTPISVDELPILYESRAVLEPYLVRLAASRGTTEHWDELDENLARLENCGDDSEQMLGIDRRCHELTWEAADNRFVMSTVDMLYTHSHRVWHMYLDGVGGLDDSLQEHRDIAIALRQGDAEKAASITEMHIRSFQHTVRDLIHDRLEPPLG